MGDEPQVEELVGRAAQGDERALAALLTGIRPRIFRWALVHTTAPDDAEDITQQTLLRVSSRLRDYQQRARFTTWVFAITRSTAADWRRTQRRRTALLQRHLPATRPSVQQQHDDHRLVALVRAQLAMLPARQRELLDLVDLQGHPPAEAAELLSLNPNTARVHLLRARRAMRARILALQPQIVEELR